MKLLIGYDGSDDAKAAIRRSPLAGFGDDVEAKVVCVCDAALEQLDTPDPGEPAWDLAAAQAIAEHRAAEGATLVATTRPGWRVESQAHVGHPGRQIASAAESWPADLVLVGSHGRGFVGRLLIGSVSHFLVTHCRRSVRISRGREDRDPAQPPRIMLAVDESRDSRAALREVAQRVWPRGTKVWAVSVARLPTAPVVAEELPRMYADVAEVCQRVRAVARRVSNAAAGALAEAGIGATALALEGDPKREILEAAKKHRVDCIFVGARGHSMAERVLLGSVSTAIAINARCSVEVVRPEERTAQAATANQ